MKKIAILIGLFTFGATYSQTHNVRSVDYKEMTTTEMNAFSSPSEGETIFNSTTKTHWVYNGTSWVDTGSGGGSGDVTGPASATDNAIARYDGATGKIVQNSGVTIDDSGNITTLGDIEGETLISTDISTSAINTSSLVSSTGTFSSDVEVSGRLLVNGAEGIRLGKTDLEPTGVEGDIYADDSENRPKYNDGTSWKAFLLAGDVVGGGTDDQTAAEVPITDSGGYYTGTEVEAALQEVAASVVTANSNIADKADKTNVLELDNTTPFTPDADYEPATKKYVDDEIAGISGIDATYLANLGKTYPKAVTNGYTMVSDDFRQTTGTHRGKFTELLNATSNDIEITANTAIPDSASVAIHNKIDGSIKVLADTGLAWEYHANENPVVPDSTRALVHRFGNVLSIDGAVNWASNVTHIFPQDNAASVSDVNSEGSFTESAANVLEVETVNVDSGTYALKINTVSTSNDIGSIVISDLNPSSTYRVTARAWENDTNSFSRMQILAADVDGASDVFTTIDGAAWATYTLDFDPAGTSVTLHLQNNTSANIAARYSIWDNIEITEL